MSSPLTTYLNDHLMGATSGVEMFRRVASAIPEVAAIADEVAEDRDALVRLVEAVGGSPDQLKVALGWLGEKASRVKLGGSLLGRGPLADLEDLEALYLGVQGKLAGWRLLRSLEDPRLTGLDELVDRAVDQLARLDVLRLAAGAALKS